MTKVKICGMTSEEDIEIVNALLPDYVGFVFCPSKRRVAIEKAKALCAALDSRIQKVGVFVNQDRRTIESIQAECGLDVVQLHGDEAPSACQYDGEVWKAIRVRDSASLMAMNDYDVDRFLLDAYNDGAYGGTGQMLNWDLLRSYNGRDLMILAGGLSPENIETAVATVCPYAVDVSSGVEKDGKKDFDKVKAFIEKVRGCCAHE